MKKIICVLVCLLITVSASISAFALPAGYYQKLDVYSAAVNSGDDYGICATAEELLSLFPNPTPDEYKSVVWTYYNAALSYERIGNYDKAAYYYKKYIETAEYLQQHTSEDHTDNIKGFKSALKHIDTEPELYFASTAPKDTPYYGAKHEERYGTFTGMCNTFDPAISNAYLLYVAFFSEDISSFGYLIPSNAEYLDVAWNVPGENKNELDMIASGAYDDYIKRNISYLATLGNKVFLRFGAEVNVWDMPSDSAAREAYIQSYKNAFIKIANYTRQLAPNTAIVYSPNDISNWYVKAEDFYPGDEYVDWVGMSTYPNAEISASNKAADYVDAYYCRGLYDNAIVRIKDIVDAFGDRKPIMISECGFAYGRDGVQNTARAMKKCREFYSYVNMVYPQIKGILYFNHNMEKDYALSSNPELKAVYDEMMRSNISIQASLNDTTEGYSKFASIDEALNTLRLFTYAKYPNGGETSVAYTLDGAPVYASSVVPFEAKIDVESLSLGHHVLTQAVSCGSYYTVKEYEFYVGRGHMLSAQPIENTIQVLLNQSPVAFDQPPVLISGRTMVPLRAIFEALGAQIQWDNDTQTVISHKADREIRLTIGENMMYVNDEAKELDVPAMLINSRTLVPVRAISESLGCDVDWDNDTQTVIITQ